MELLKRTTVALAAVATLGVGTAHANLILIGPVTLGGTGLGTVSTVLTLTSSGNNTTESGCVGRSGGADFIGSAISGPCSGSPSTDVHTGASQTLTRTLAEAGITSGANFALLLNAAEPAGNGITLNTLSATFYGANGQTFTASCVATGAGACLNVDFPNTATGTGNSGFMFTLDAAQAASVQSLIAANGGNTANVRVGLSTSLGNPLAATGGQETFFIFNSATTTSVTPEPSTTALMATGLIGLVGFIRRRRS